MIGEGTYSLAEAARYAGVPQTTLRTWFAPRAGSNAVGPLFSSDLRAVDSDQAVNFLNLIEIYVARHFRNAGVQPSILRRAYQILQAELKTRHPFAHADVGTDGKRIIEKKGDAELVDVISKQRFFEQMKLDRIDYNAVSRLAGLWRIAPGVVINPRVGFGKPVADGTGVSTYILANQFTANRNNAEVVAELYDVTTADVRHAVKFEAEQRQKAA